MRFLAPFLLTAFATASSAQDNPNTILVLDGSGSMWGQIDGVAKITIAQEVVSALMDTIPPEQNIGLTVYGHRERGNCTDIETIVAPGPNTRDAIRDAVNGIKPLGKTPMTDSIIAAAEALRYTEDSATVILVSDGVETCNPDPCAAMRLLEEAAIDFTAHVVGFDVGSDAVALAQMQCIAEETGGQFLTADNAEELGAALQTVAAEPDPVGVTMTFTAVVGEDAALVTSPVLWDINSDAGMFAEDLDGNPLTADLLEGAYVATAYSLEYEQTVNVDFIVIDGGATEVTAVFEEPIPTARLVAPSSAPAGSNVQVGWDGPGHESDFVGIGAVGAEGGNQWQNYTYVRDGNPITLLMPATAGDYVIQYFSNDGARTAIAQTPITLLPVEASITAPAEAPAGAEISVAWTGPDYDSDFIGIGKADAEGGNQWENYTRTSDGSPLMLLVPTEPGDYLIQYFVNQDRTIYATAPIKVVDVKASITAPTEAQSGSEVEVTWTGPGYENDFIGIGKVGANGGNQWENYTRTNEGSPLTLTVPTEPGDYLIQYFINQDREIIATAALTVTDVAASVTAPASAPAGSDITVSWTGPDYENDFIGIGKVGATGGNQWKNYTRTSDGATLTLTVPTEPGDYLIQYFVNQDRTIIASTPFIAEPVKATITAPDTAVAGQTISVTWEGPDYESDFIGIGEAGATGGSQWVNYTRTNEGETLALRVPSLPGDYVIKYFVNQDRSVLAQHPITVSEATGRLIAPATAPAGTDLIVGWDGPDYEGDFIGVGKVGAEGGGRWERYERTNTGNPVTVRLPDEPGDYEVTYFIDQGRVPIATVPLTLE
ncbi:Ca-activated chloride channel family protein [Cognatiyoonia koreensis]|uniref:Ca-activated chloride channel family protein n=1 Tax=Cognatiyoonia koreensis TaxID=364200 RepID=A0A1I0PNF1_9RHOB|nr:VWA domain-containing protein [Cognatiyoonia koreensis]SEW15775.1 Ca-activated chloride channel family protein [Cognatiyoonia koreensis]